MNPDEHRSPERPSGGIASLARAEVVRGFSSSVFICVHLWLAFFLGRNRRTCGTSIDNPAIPPRKMAPEGDCRAPRVASLTAGQRRAVLPEPTGSLLSPALLHKFVEERGRRALRFVGARRVRGSEISLPAAAHTECAPCRPRPTHYALAALRIVRLNLERRLLPKYFTSPCDLSPQNY